MISAPIKVSDLKEYFPWTGIAMTTRAILDYKIALDYILAKQDGVCSVVLGFETRVETR